MSNQYILFMSNTELIAPMDKETLVAIARRWDAQIFTRVDDARKCAHPLVKFYGLTRCDDEITHQLEKFGAGAVGLVATSTSKKLYIIKIDDHQQTIARYTVGK